MSSELDSAWVRAQLLELGTELGRPLEHLHTTTSTNDVAKEASKAGAVHGSCFVADEQTRGRGRRGRSWLSTTGEALLFSLVLRPTGLVDPSPLTLAVGLGVHQAASRHVGAALGIKWPNDLVFERRKVAGILVETELTQDVPSALVVGVGVNVSATSFEPELRDIAVSMGMLGSDVTRERLLVDILGDVSAWYRRFVDEGVGALLEPLRRVDALLGKRVRVDGVEGCAIGFDDTGHLLLERSDGSPVSITAGTVEWV